MLIEFTVPKFGKYRKGDRAEVPRSYGRAYVALGKAKQVEAVAEPPKAPRKKRKYTRRVAKPEVTAVMEPDSE